MLNGRVFVLNSAGVLQAAEVSTGKVLWKLRLKGDFSASPVGSGAHLVFFNEAGLGLVIDVSGDEEGKIVSENDLKETVISTPALVDDAIFVRSEKHLWKLK